MVDKVNTIIKYCGSIEILLEKIKSNLELSLGDVVEVYKYILTTSMEYDFYFSTQHKSYIDTIRFEDDVCTKVYGKTKEVVHIIDCLYKAIIREENINCILNDDCGKS